MSERALELKVGLVLLVAGLVLAGFILLLGDFNLGGGRRLLVEYAFSGAIQPGAPVKISGVKVGQVEDIHFVPSKTPDSDVQVRLVLFLEERAAPVLTDNAKFYINTQGLLGEHYVEVIPARAPGGPLADGAVVRGVDPPRFDLLFQRLFEVLAAVSRLLEDNEDIVEALVRSAAGLAQTVDGTLKDNRAAIGATIANAERASGDAAELLSGLRRVVGDGAKLERAVDDLAATTGLVRKELPPTFERVQAALAMLEKIEGILDALPKAEVQATLAETRAALTKVNAVLTDAQMVTTRIRSGGGTVGLLLADDEIYDDLKALLKDLKQHPWKLVWKD